MSFFAGRACSKVRRQLNCLTMDRVCLLILLLLNCFIGGIGSPSSSVLFARTYVSGSPVSSFYQRKYKLKVTKFYVHQKKNVFWLYKRPARSQLIRRRSNENIPILPEAYLTFASKSCWPLLWGQATI